MKIQPQLVKIQANNKLEQGPGDQKPGHELQMQEPPGQEWWEQELPGLEPWGPEQQRP